MKTELAWYLFGVATPFLAIGASRVVERTREWVREWLGRKCPICHGDGYTEYADVGSRSIAIYPCRCRAGRGYRKAHNLN